MYKFQPTFVSRDLIESLAPRYLSADISPVQPNWNQTHFESQIMRIFHSHIGVPAFRGSYMPVWGLATLSSNWVELLYITLSHFEILVWLIWGAIKKYISQKVGTVHNYYVYKGAVHLWRQPVWREEISRSGGDWGMVKKKVEFSTWNLPEIWLRYVWEMYDMYDVCLFNF